MTKTLTTVQQHALDSLNNHKGETVNVVCSAYDNGICKEFLNSAVLRTTTSTLRSLEKKGLIKVNYFWRGASVQVLKGE